MKNFLSFLVLFILLSTMISAIDLADFPEGSWIDQKYNAVWTFSTTNIVLTMIDGTPVFDFDGKIQNFKLSPGMDGLQLTFSSEEAGRSYKFIKDVSSLSLKMIIDRNNGEHYEVVMPIQK